MTTSLDLSADQDVLDGLAVATLASTGTDTALAIPNALRLQVDRREKQTSQGIYTAYYTRWQLPSDLTLAPKPADTITDAAGTIWTVLGVKLLAFSNYYACDCIALALTYELQQTIAWLKTTVANSHGSRVVGHDRELYGIHARVQPLAADEIEFQSKLGFDVDWVVYSASDFPATQGDLIRNEITGVEYEVKRYFNRQRLDELATYLVKIRP